ncbi:hypothetical protein BH23CHL2_BH23CHL2_05420 [soil metagenome]
MGHLVTTIIGLSIIGVLAWAAQRLKQRIRGAKGDRPESDSRAIDEAEILSRGKGPFV